MRVYHIILISTSQSPIAFPSPHLGSQTQLAWCRTAAASNGLLHSLAEQPADPAAEPVQERRDIIDVVGISLVYKPRIEIIKGYFKTIIGVFDWDFSTNHN